VPGLVQGLRASHRRLGGEAQLPPRLLLQRRRPEGCGRLSPVGPILDRGDRERRTLEPFGERSRPALVELDDIAFTELAGRRPEVLPLSDALALEREESGLERARVEGREEIPVLGGPEGHALTLALDDEAGRPRLPAPAPGTGGRPLPAR